MKYLIAFALVYLWVGFLIIILDGLSVFSTGILGALGIYVIMALTGLLASPAEKAIKHFAKRTDKYDKS